MNTAAALIAEIKGAAERLGIAPSTLCQRAVKNSKLVLRLEGGQTVTLDTVAALRAYIAANAKTKRAA